MLYLLTAFSRSIGIEYHEEKAFLSWMRKYKQIYIGDEYFFRLGIYLTNKRFIQEHNRGEYSYKLGENQFAALSPSEYQTLLSSETKVEKKTKGSPLKLPYRDLPASFDWRTKGVITPVKDQKECVAGWAFSCAGLQESMWAIIKNELVPCSVAQVIDCDWDAHACNGGTNDGGSFFVLYEEEAIWMTEEEYQYQPEKGTCKFDKTKTHQTFLDLHYALNETDMAHMIAEYGVISFGYDCSLSTFTYYKDGVYDDPSCDLWNLCHYMLIVGYGSENGKDYWLSKNSFGTTWGIDGYCKLVRNKNGQCGIDLLTYTHLID